MHEGVFIICNMTTYFLATILLGVSILLQDQQVIEREETAKERLLQLE